MRFNVGNPLGYSSPIIYDREARPLMPMQQILDVHEKDLSVL